MLEGGQQACPLKNNNSNNSVSNDEEFRLDYPLHVRSPDSQLRSSVYLSLGRSLEDKLLCD